MNKTIFNLLKIYFRQIFYSQFERLKSSGKTENKAKKYLRQFGFLILIAYGFGVMLSGWGYVSFNLLKSLNSIGDSQIRLGQLIYTKTDLIVLVLSFFTAIISLLNILFTFFSVNFFLNLSTSEEYIITLPIKDSTLFSSKIIVISILNGFFFFLLNFILFISYGIVEKLSFDYYIIFIIDSSLIVFFSSLLAIALSLLLVNIFKFLKNKDLITYLSIFIFLPILVGYNIFFQNLIQNSSIMKDALFNVLNKGYNTIKIIKAILGPINLFNGFIVTTLVKVKTIYRFIYLLIQIGILILFFKLILIIFSPIYKKLLLMTGIKKEKKGKNGFKKNFIFKQKHSFLALLKKEVFTTYREPTYFLNGPFVIVLMPLILGITFYFQSKNSSDITNLLSILINNTKNSGLFFSIAIVASFLIGDFSSITSTAISREGKSFSILKSLPINPKEFIISKILHGLILTTFGSLLIGIFLFFLTKISFLLILFVIFISVISSIIFHIICLSLDLGKPKLNWDNPIIAMKQNFNAVYAIFIAMGYAVFLFFQTKFIFNFCLNFIRKYINEITYRPALLNIIPLLILLFIVIIENIVLYFILYSRLEKQFYEIEN